MRRWTPWLTLVLSACSTNESSNASPGASDGGGTAGPGAGGGGSAGNAGSPNGSGGSSGASSGGVPSSSGGASAGSAGVSAGSGGVPATGGTSGTGGGGGFAAGTGGMPTSCGWQDRGAHLQIAEGIAVCLPPVVCTEETCPPALGDCVDGQCVFKGGYLGLLTLPEAWATQYCNLANGSCNGVTQHNPANVTAGAVAAALGYSVCGQGSAGAPCVGIMASSPVIIGNAQVAKDPQGNWGLGLSEASGLCYEITGPGGTAVVAVTDRCAGYCRCGAGPNEHCLNCITSGGLEPNCPCVGSVPPLYGQCCGRGCPTLDGLCDWCASQNHPHFDLDDATFAHVCGPDGPMYGSCQLSAVRYLPCMEPLAWPPP